jgi:lipopolysaccharide transport system permease protein
MRGVKLLAVVLPPGGKTTDQGAGDRVARRATEAPPAPSGGVGPGSSGAPLPQAAEVSSRPSLIASLREFIAFRELLWTLTVREVKIRYKQTLLGVAWAVAQPLGLMLAFSIFFGRFAGIPSEGLPYPLFSYAALLPWTFFTTSLAFGVPSLVNNATLVTKVYFPREILPLASVLSAGVDFAAGAVVYGLLMVYYRIAPTGAFAYLLPLLAVQLGFTVGVTLILAAINVSYRDVRYALPLVTQIWLYTTPVIYPLSVIPARIRGLYLAVNPMAAVIEGYRRVLVAGAAPDQRMLALAGASAAALLFAGYVYFKRAERSFADVI